MYKLEESDYGEYVKIEDDGKKYSINECNAAFTPKGLNVGYTYFRSREECLEAWSLKKVEQKDLFFNDKEYN